MGENDKFASQKKYLSNRKQLRVWVEQEKYQQFQMIVTKNKQSIYSVINDFISEYIKSYS